MSKKNPYKIKVQPSVKVTVHIPNQRPVHQKLLLFQDRKRGHDVCAGADSRPVQEAVFETVPDLPETTAKRSKTYRERRTAEQEAWQQIQTELLQAKVQSEVPPIGHVCWACGFSMRKLFRCTDCFDSAENVMCEQCTVSRHEVNSLHCPEQWHGNCYRKLTVPEKLVLPHQKICATRYSRSLTLIDRKGRPHVSVCLQFCKCEKEAIILYRHGFWPTSPVSPNVAVSLYWLDVSHYLTMECQVSAKGYVQANGSLHSIQKLEKSGFRQVLEGDALPLYRVHKTQSVDVWKLFLDVDSYKSSLCPACPKENGKVVVAMDANFQLVHKQNAAKDQQQAQIASTVFVDQQIVDKFVDQHSSNEKSQDVECSQFQAGSVVRSKRKAAKLNYRGLFAASCRHEIPLKFMNMKHGERLAYPVLMLKLILEDLAEKDVQLYMLYDIACILQKHMKGTDVDYLLNEVELAIPVFHCYGHKGSCQITLNPRRLVGFGLSDGEWTERIWSYLGKFSHIVKEQTAAHHNDLLTAAALYLAQKKANYLEFTLVERIRRAEEVWRAAEQKMQELCLEIAVPGGVTDDLLATWHRDEHILLTQRTVLDQGRATWQEKYVLDILLYNKIGNQIGQARVRGDAAVVVDLSAQRQQLATKLDKCERIHTIVDRWSTTNVLFQEALLSHEDKKKMALVLKLRPLAVEKQFLYGIRRKYSDGQTTAGRILRQIKKVSKSIHNLVKAYNGEGFTSIGSAFPNIIIYEDIASPSAALYNTLEQNS